MTSGEPPTSPSAAKIGGFALIGVGAVSAVLGVATLVSGGPEDTAAPPVDQQQTAAPLPPLPPAPVGSEQPPASSSVADPPPAADDPPQAPDPEPQAPPVNQPRPEAPDAEHGRRHIVVRVYNNSTVKGLAHQAADDFRSVGYDVPEVGNYARGTIPTTTVYYRPGTAEEAQAKEVAAAFQARAEPRFEGVGDASPGVIAIITNDYKGLGKGGK